jgi:hypothetical protein
MTSVKIVDSRLINQQLAQHVFTRAGDVVAWLGMVQAQDYPAAKWALGLRLSGATDAGIEQALTDRTIVRTWACRGTLQLIAPADVRWLVELVAPRVIAMYAAYYRKLELDGNVLKASHNVMVQALQGGNALTRKELAAALQARDIPTDKGRLGFLLLRAAVDRLICQGPRRGKQFTFVLLDEWVPATKSMERPAALAELTRRYFASHGPATAQDFAWWAGLTLADARAGLSMVGGQLRREELDGQTYWMPQTMPAVTKKAKAIYLLPDYDEYTVGYQDRSAMLDADVMEQLGEVRGSVLNPVIVLNGKVIGMWKRTFEKNGVVIAARLLRSPSKSEERALEMAVERYGAFLGTSATLALRKGRS